MGHEQKIYSPQENHEDLEMTAEHVVSMMERNEEIPRNLVARSSPGHVDFTGFDFRGRTLQRPYFPEANLQEANFSGVMLKLPEFQCANLRNASFEGAIIESHDWSRADVRGASFFNTTFVWPPKMENAFFDDTTVFPEGFDTSHMLKIENNRVCSYDSKQRQWHWEVLINRKMSSIDFQGIDMSHVKIQGGTINSASFEGVMSIVGAVFDGCYVFDARFSGADLSGCDFRTARGLKEAVLTGALYDDATQFSEGFMPEDYGMIKK